MLGIINPHPVSDGDISSLERHLKFKLPEDYRIFLKKNNGGTFNSLAVFKRKLSIGEQEMGIANFLDIELIKGSHENLRDLPEYKNLCVIAEILGAPVVCVGVSPENNGQVFYFGLGFWSNIPK